VALNVPLERYSREEATVVNDATGTWDSSFAPSVKVQSSGVVTMAGSPDATLPSAGAAVLE
jgi:hypothetical protein